MKAGIVIGSWKLPIFERHLSQSGYAVVKCAGLTASTMLLKVETENHEALQIVVQAANTEAARTGAPR